MQNGKPQIEPTALTPLKKDRFDIIFPGAVSAVLALVVGMLTTSLLNSFSRGIGIFFLSFVIFSIQFYSFPPWQVARRFNQLLLIIFFSAAVLCTFFADTRSSWWIGLSLAIVEALLAFLYVIELAFRNFKQLQEIQQIGPGMKQKLDTTPLASHITDVHITAAGNVATLEGDRSGHDCLERWLMSLKQIKPEYLIISGDITDTGSKDEWKRFEDTIEKLIPPDSTLILAPGNHDLSLGYGMANENKLRLFFEFNRQWCQDLISALGPKISDIFLLAEDEIRDRIEARAEKERNDFIFLRNVPRLPRDKLDHPVLFNQRLEIAKNTNWLEVAHDNLLDEWFNHNWYNLFPLQMHDREKGVLTLILNSVIRSPLFLGESALGAVGEEQMARIDEILNSLPPWTRNILLVTHHAPFRHSGEWRLLTKESIVKDKRFKTTIKRIKDFALLSQEVNESRKLINIISDATDKYQHVNFFLFCGHRHTGAAGHAGRVLILEGSSTVKAKATTWFVYEHLNQVAIYQELIPYFKSAKGFGDVLD